MAAQFLYEARLLFGANSGKPKHYCQLFIAPGFLLRQTAETFGHLDVMPRFSLSERIRNRRRECMAALGLTKQFERPRGRVVRASLNHDQDVNHLGKF
jgi:hypothetical protein